MADEEAATPLLSPITPIKPEWNLQGTFSASLAILTGVALTLLAIFGIYTEDATDEHVSRYWSWLCDVYVMVFIGFGFLMTFLKRYSYSAVAFNMVTSCIAILEAILAVGWAQQGFGHVVIDLPLIIDAAFCAGAAMISFGAVLGKATPTQILWLVAFEAPLYAVNAQLVTGRWGALDVGGSITIHAFGAFYGLAASACMRHPAAGAGHPKSAASYSSDITAMIGTLFLFIYWPSFNGALASAPGSAAQPQVYCIMNTVVALLGSCLAGFATSAALEGKLDMVHVQNATLAGGVAIGSSANLRLPPAAALAVGIVAGTLSTVGYVFASPRIERRLFLTDTCGVFNLHGCPGVLGGLASALFVMIFASGNDLALISHGKAQPLWQLLALGVTVAVAVVGGAVAGVIVSNVNLGKQSLTEDELYEDCVFWKEEVEEHED